MISAVLQLGEAMNCVMYLNQIDNISFLICKIYRLSIKYSTRQYIDIFLLTKEATASTKTAGYDKYTDTCIIIMFSITNH